MDSCTAFRGAGSGPVTEGNGTDEEEGEEDGEDSDYGADEDFAGGFVGGCGARLKVEKGVRVGEWEIGEECEGDGQVEVVGVRAEKEREHFGSSVGGYVESSCWGTCRLRLEEASSDMWILMGRR